MEVMKLDHTDYLYDCGVHLREEGTTAEDADHKLWHWDISFDVPFTDGEKASFWKGFNGEPK